MYRMDEHQCSNCGAWFNTFGKLLAHMEDVDDACNQESPLAVNNADGSLNMMDAKLVLQQAFGKGRVR